MFRFLYGFLTNYFSYFTKRKSLQICGGEMWRWAWPIQQIISLWETLIRSEKQEHFGRAQTFAAPGLTLHTVVSACGQQVLFYTIRTVKTFHLQVITHINRQNEENITYVQTHSPGHKSILTPPTFVRWGGELSH